MMKTGVRLLVAACLSCCSGGTPSGNGKLECRTMAVEGGYGYVVLHGGDTLICQPFVPAVGGRRPFGTRKEALAVGKLVCRKLADGQPPAVNKEEIEWCLAGTGVCRDRQ